MSGNGLCDAMRSSGPATSYLRLPKDGVQPFVFCLLCLCVVSFVVGRACGLWLLAVLLGFSTTLDGSAEYSTDEGHRQPVVQEHMEDGV